MRALASEFRERRMPCDVLWHDIDYMDGFRVFTFDGKKFPDPAGLNRDLHAAGFKTVWMIDPGVKVDENYLVESIRNPAVKVVDTYPPAMPPFPQLKDKEIDAIIMYLKTLK